MSVIIILFVPSVRMLRREAEDFKPMRKDIQRFVSIIILTGLSCIVKFLPYKFALSVNVILRDFVCAEH